MDSQSPNPFATRFTKPGAVKFLLGPDQSLAQLLDVLRQNAWWGELIGPHGVGKSTLLAALVPELVAAGRQPESFVIAPDRPHPTWTKEQISGWTSTTQVIVDGSEQLSWWNLMRLKRAVKARQAGLLITAHHSLGLPPLIALSPQLQVAQAVVEKLLPPGDATILPTDVATVFQTQGGNIRETLFALYDLYQLRSRS